MASETQGSTTTTYSYDGTGLRFQAATGSQNNRKTQFDWDPRSATPQVVAERDGSGGLVRRYVDGLDAISVTGSNKTGYFHYDGLGSVTNLTSSTGTSWWTYNYFPYGAVRTETKNNNQALDNSLRFAGEYLDPTGVYYLRAREYDPNIGRFISPDPAQRDLGQMYLAPCAYAKDNPVRFVDPNGLESQDAGACPVATVLAVLGVIALFPADLVVGAANVLVLPSVIGEAALLPADVGLTYANGYLLSVAQKGGNQPCDQIRLEHPENPFGG